MLLTRNAENGASESEYDPEEEIHRHIRPKRGQNSVYKEDDEGYGGKAIDEHVLRASDVWRICASVPYTYRKDSDEGHKGEYACLTADFEKEIAAIGGESLQISVL